MNKFENFIHKWDLIGCLLKGMKYTLSNFRDNSSLNRLDRFLYCNNWEDLFPGRS